MKLAVEKGIHERSRLEEERLLLLMKTGDQEAFRKLYERTARSIYSYALSILKHPQDAEEVMQDTYRGQAHGLAVYHSQKSVLYEA